jgi:hypothetical protein
MTFGIEKERKDLVRVGAEGAEIAEADDFFAAAAVGVIDRGAKCDVVGVDAAEQRDARNGRTHRPTCL